MKTSSPFFRQPLALGLASVAFLAAANVASAVVIAGYDFRTASISNSNTYTATATNTAAAQPGVTPSNFSLAGADSATTTAISISGGTNTAYIQGTYTPVASGIYTGSRYFTFSVSLATAYSLSSLTFDFGGTNSTATAATNIFGAQIQIGAGSFKDLTTASGLVAAGTANYATVGSYFADLSAYQNITGNVTVRIFVADDINDNGSTARFKNVALNATAVPEAGTTAALAAGLALCAFRRRRGH